MANPDSLHAVRSHGPLAFSVGSAVRRVPQPKRPPRPVVLTDRDERILVALHQNRVLTAELVGWAFFPASGGRRRSPSSSAYDRISRLFAAGYIGKLRFPSPLGGGSYPQVLVLESPLSR